MERKTVAIVIPTYNRAEFLENAIEKSLAQTYPCQIVVSDHGSTDNTAQLMEKYKGRVKYIKKEKNFGPHFSWLEGVLNADAEFIHLQFDDDWIEKDFIEKTVAMMQDDVGFVFTEAYGVNEETNEKNKCFNLSKKFIAGIHPAKTVEQMLMSGLMISPAACLYRKKDVIDALYQGNLPILEDNCYFGVGPDHFMSLICLLRYKKVGVITEPLTIFRAHSGSITVDACNNVQKLIRLGRAYEAIKVYYRLLKLFNNCKFLRIFLTGKNWLSKLNIKSKCFSKKLGCAEKNSEPANSRN